MASDDTAALVVALSAQVSQFQADLDKAAGIADQQAKKIEDRFRAINPGASFVDELSGKLAKLATIGGIGELISQLASLNEQAAKIGDSAARVGLTTDQFQAFRFAVVTTGGSIEQADNFLDVFSRKIAEAATGTGALYNFLRVNNVALKDSSGQLLPLNVLLQKYADLVKNTASPQER